MARAGVTLRPALSQWACQLTGVPSAHPDHTLPPQATRIRGGHAFTRAKTERGVEGGLGEGVGEGQAGNQRSGSLDLIQVERSLIH